MIKSYPTEEEDSLLLIYEESLHSFFFLALRIVLQVAKHLQPPTRQL